MNREHFEKLLQATREAPAETFNMSVFAGQPTACGTPACLLGNYALRTDLQSEFRAKTDDYMGHIVSTATGQRAHLDGLAVCEHFDITSEQADALFDADGCNDAGTDRDKAIAYVEHFMATGETPYVEYEYDDDDDDDGWTDDEVCE